MITDEGSYVNKIRHSCAHLLANAVKELYLNEVQVIIGPVIENGFYYDFFFENNKTLNDEDLIKIEERMIEIRDKNLPLIKEFISYNDALKLFKDLKEEYKIKILNKIQKDEKITIYKQGNFLDLCRGPHIENTKEIKFFKLTKVSGSYWEGNSKNQKLQRVYGVAFENKKDLDDYLNFLKEAEKIDHRKLGSKLELFKQIEYSPGDVFWLPNGVFLYNKLKEIITNEIKDDYQEVITPQLVNKKLWELSGHWDKYKENMFISSVDDEESEFALKPMNCPCHMELFKSEIRSYKDLPLRYSEFGKCHRYEPKGSLYGLMRVRSFCQDDGHIFCTEDQIESEAILFYNLVKKIYSKFGFDEVLVKVSTRPDIYAGDLESWDKAEKSLFTTLEKNNIKYDIQEKEGAFYGPKLEFQLKDCIGRSWQCGTFQVDFVLPKRLEVFYIDKNDTKKHPVVLHRAVFGSIERFIGILIEHYKGKFPIWLSPIQYVVLGVSNKFDEYVDIKFEDLQKKGFRVVADKTNERLGNKIRKYTSLGIDKENIIVIGEKEIDEILKIKNG